MDSKAIGERLKELRISKNLSIKDAAEALEISQSAIMMYEAGERIPRDEIKKRIAAYYKRSVNTIFFAD